MNAPLPLSAAAAWGAACGAALGALRTRDAALHLLAKNRVLEAAGFLPLPGAGHGETLGSWLPAAAGALFFGLSLGLGAGTLLGLWVRVTRTLPSRVGRLAPWAALAVPFWAATAGDPLLAAALGAMAAGALATQLPGRVAPARASALRALVLVLMAVGFLPWATAPEGPFTHLRDRHLLDTAVGRAVNGFYYRWTLYPAEVLKPVAALSQPTAAAPVPLPASVGERFCRDALGWGVLCVDDPAGADLHLLSAEPGLELARGGARVAWPQDPSARTDAWKALSSLADRARALRQATYWALFLGCPLALAWGFSSLALAAGALLGGGRRSTLASLAVAGLLAASLGAAGRPDRSLSEVRARLGTEVAEAGELRAALAAPSAVERFYGARAAGRARLEADALVEALSDPVVNVRYAAAEALGRTGGGRSREALLEVLRSPEEWYVKERAYAALWRLGWRGR
ncbi:MAG: HEAT repeat domain-containing protein [Thermodesulfobacteriota bacterium]